MKDTRVAEALDWLDKRSRRSIRKGMARYAIPADKALGVRMADIQKLAKLLGRDHALALALWETDVYEARMLSAYVDEPARVTSAQMDSQARDFDNWAVCDTLCFALWVRTPHAFAKICLPLIEKAAADERNFVRKAVSWALRGVGRRSAGLHKASLELARKLAASTDPAPRWVGKDAFRELSSEAVRKRLRRRGRKPSRTGQQSGCWPASFDPDILPR